MTWAITYASRAHMKLTTTRYVDEPQARTWYGRIQTWKDVVRVRITDETTGEVRADCTIAARMACPDNPKLEEKIKELVARMDAAFVPDRVFEYELHREQKRREVQTGGEEKCLCGHLKVEHHGPASDGRCHAQCITKCPRFRRRP